MSINKMRVSIILPCRDEGRGLVKLIASFPKLVDEVVVINNRSRINPGKYLAKIPKVRVVSDLRVDESGIGYGYALQTGLRVASGDIILSMDGDGTYPSVDIEKVVLQLIKQKLDMVMCSRFPLDTEKSISWFRQFGVWLLNMEARILFRYQGHDILSGMWAIRREIVPLLNLSEGGWNLSPEIKLSALANERIKVEELHIDHYVRDYGKSKQVLWRTGIEHFMYIIRRWAKREDYRYEKAI